MKTEHAAISCDKCLLNYAAVRKNLESCIEFESLHAKEAEQVLKLFDKFNRIVKTEEDDESNKNKEMLQMWEIVETITSQELLDKLGISYLGENTMVDGLIITES